jgi:hypothetical protein
VVTASPTAAVRRASHAGTSAFREPRANCRKKCPGHTEPLQVVCVPEKRTRMVLMGARDFLRLRVNDPLFHGESGAIICDGSLSKVGTAGRSESDAVAARERPICVRGVTCFDYSMRVSLTLSTQQSRLVGGPLEL